MRLINQTTYGRIELPDNWEAMQTWLSDDATPLAEVAGNSMRSYVENLTEMYETHQLYLKEKRHEP